MGRSATATRRRSIPKTYGLPLVGPLAELLTDPLSFFVKSYVTRGPVFQVKVPTRKYTVLAGHEANLFFLKEDQRLFEHAELYQNIARELDASHYMIATSGDRHANLRRSSMPAFATDVLDAATPRLLEEIGRRARAWQPGTRLRVLDLMHELIGDVIVTALAGRALGSHLRDAVTFARFSMGCGLGGYPVQFRYAPHYQMARRRMFPLFREIVQWHRDNPVEVAERCGGGAGDGAGGGAGGANAWRAGGGNASRAGGAGGRAADFIDQVLAVRDENGQPLSDDNIVALAQTVYSNALLYAAPTMAFLLYSLLAAPEVMARCRQEIDETFGQGTPDLTQLRAAEYFGATLRESQRMHPIGLAAPRVAKETFTFAGYEIPRGERVLIALTACHYLPEIYPSPYSFEPERHMEPRNESRATGVFAPFGYGAHSCLAARLVDGMTRVVVAGLVRNAELELDRADYTIRKRVNPFPEPAGDLVVRVVGGR
ncbi:MAG TPA: cytochrome P450 [Candidatus Limnocylindrales bacterium]|nr:cytochrome P450 [Candidatus Limnocylindrales bacterium]